MLPQAYELPAALLLVLAGALACFAGHRLFRYVLALFGFILGAMMASSTMGISNSVGMVAAALVGGLLGAAILVFAYFIGIALVGAGLGALIAHQVWYLMRPGDPPVLVVVGAALVGAVLAMVVQRYVIIVGTALGGAWTMIIGVVNVLAARGITRWAPIAWIVLSIAGIAVQLGTAARRK